MVEDVGVVVIGRNEGERLRRCLDSVSSLVSVVVYVDSNSTDSSVSMANIIGVHVLELDASLPFTAARARNAGFDRLQQLCPNVEYVFFIDGDCEMDVHWLDRACEELDRRDDAAIVCGRLRERCPEKSLFNRIVKMEWDQPYGNVGTCGGIFVIRAGAFEQVGRFDPAISAGEEPELCWRLRLRNWKIVRLRDNMALHDLAMSKFSQWWKREIRHGSGGFDVWARTGRERNGPFSSILRSAWRWGVIWPTVTVATVLLGWCVGGRVSGLAMLSLGLLAWAAQLTRIATMARRRGFGWGDSMAYGFLTLIGKWAQMYGRFKRTGQNALLKRAASLSTGGPNRSL